MDDAPLDNPELQDTSVGMAKNTQQLSHHLSMQTYCNSSESKRLFGAYDEDHHTLIAIIHKIEKLGSVNQTIDGYQNAIEGDVPHNFYIQTQIFEIQQCCVLLCMAYSNA